MRYSLPAGIPRYFPRFLDESLHDDYFQEVWVQALLNPSAAPRSIPIAALSAVRRNHGYQCASRMWSRSPQREVPASGRPVYEDAGPEREVRWGVSSDEADLAAVLKRNTPSYAWQFIDHVLIGTRLHKPMSPAGKTRSRKAILATLVNLDRVAPDIARRLRDLFTDRDL